MKIKNVLLIGMVGLAISANATIIDLGTTIGQPADPASELNRLNTLLISYNDVNDPNLPLATEWEGYQTQIEDGDSSYSFDLTEFDGYFMLKWGNMDHFYYICDENVNFTFYSDNGRGLSHYTTFQVVPESSTIFAGLTLLLPLFMSGFKIIKRHKFVS